MSIVSKSDFIGNYFISQKLYDDLDLYIEKYEKQYLINLLGAELYKLFISDLDSNFEPTTVIYQTIYNEILTDYNTCLINSEGIKKMLIKFIYFEYVRDNQQKNTTNGTVVNNAELGINVNPIYSVARAYNEACDSVYAIQFYIKQNIANYPTYNGRKFDYVSVI